MIPSRLPRLVRFRMNSVCSGNAIQLSVLFVFFKAGERSLADMKKPAKPFFGTVQIAANGIFYTLQAPLRRCSILLE